ncbi:MAG: proline--tRNA ligase [Bacillota bacterium]
MRTTSLLAPTLREVPAETETISHQLLVRGGMIRKSAAGMYSYLPLGWRVIQKISDIVRDEMNKAGGQELMLPIVQPAELWQETGRWQVYGDEMFRLKDRHQRSFCLCPTNEELITTTARNEITSYKQLPQLLYLIQNKYRDERRPRFGLMRGREFIMKDLYSFDTDEEGMRNSYQKMYVAYNNVFKRCGLNFRVVEADSGAIGGSVNHEFMVLAQVGEAEIVHCEACGYAANVERAECILTPTEKAEMKEGTLPAMELVHTPGVHTVADWIPHGIMPEQVIKTVFYKADEDILAVLVRGNREVNETKLKNLLGCIELRMATETEVLETTGARIGSVGPVKLTVPIYADNEISLLQEGVAGANKDSYHFMHVVPGRDFQWTKLADLRVAKEGDPCPVCKVGLSSVRGIEVGHLFQLGTKYSKKLDAYYTDRNGEEKLMVMGCYGIGVGRTAAAAIEQNHDEKGMIWPIAIAPYHVIVIPASNNEEAQVKTAEKIYQNLQSAGVEVVLDDRDERAGVKFMDADLIGYPVRVTVGRKTVEHGTVDVKLRKTGEEFTKSLDEAVAYIKKLVHDSLNNAQNGL